MRTRRSVLVGVSSALVLAGCTGSDSEPTTEGDDDDSSPIEESFEILNPQLNGQPLDQYDVDFPADVTPEQLADEFQHQLEYETQGANGPVESTINVEYTENTIPTEDEEPLDEQIANDEYETGDITQDIQFPDHLVEHLIENPRNIQANITAEDTETGQTTDREFTLNYANKYVEQLYRAAFEEEVGSLGESVELRQIEVNDEVIDLEYESEHQKGTEEFNLDLSSGIYAGAVSTTRIPYQMDFTLHDSDGNTHEVYVDDEPARDRLNGESSQDEFRNEVVFDYLWID